MIPWSEIILRLSLAAFFGGLVGLERERKNWAAGLRTHMLVCVGASLTMMVSAYGFADVLGTKNVVLDPSRVAAQVISGIGFIGAGTILFLREGIIRGLTTASGLWTVAAVGLATGGGMYFAALITTVLAIVILWILQPLERRFSSRFQQKTLRIVTMDRGRSASLISYLFENIHSEITTCNIDNADNEFVISIKFKNINRVELLNMITILQSDTTIKEVAWND